MVKNQFKKACSKQNFQCNCYCFYSKSKIENNFFTVCKLDSGLILQHGASYMKSRFSIHFSRHLFQKALAFYHLKINTHFIKRSSFYGAVVMRKIFVNEGALSASATLDDQIATILSDVKRIKLFKIFFFIINRFQEINIISYLQNK
jgi:hypothetical protein